jgi:UrcA family protein
MASPLIRALIAGCLAALPIAAQASDTSTTVRIDMRALDLAAPGDLKTAHRLIDRAAKAACRNDVEHLTFKARRAARHCRSAVRDLAMEQLYARRLGQMAAR